MLSKMLHLFFQANFCYTATSEREIRDELQRVGSKEDGSSAKRPVENVRGAFSGREMELDENVQTN